MQFSGVEFRPSPRAAACGGVLFIVLALSTARAEDLPAARACAAVTDPTARLACFDAAFAVKPLPPAAQFGDNAQLQQQRAPKTDVPKTLDLTITKAQPLGHGLYRLTLDNGQVWQTKESDWAMEFKTTDVITISRLPLGGYVISPVGERRTVSAKRVQ
jgi:hypothetical protein